MVDENSQKIDTSLNLSLDTPVSEREQSRNLSTGYNEDTKRWTVIVRYNGSEVILREDILALDPEAEVDILLNQYAVVDILENALQKLAQLQQVQYIEKPKQIYFSLEEGRSASCVNTLQNMGYNGKGVLVGIVDSGIDYRHPAFRNADGSTRIRYLWEQDGGVYTQEELNAFLVEKDELMIIQSTEIPSRDERSGHGTAVAGVAAGNGAGSAGKRYRGVAPESELIVVALSRGKSAFPQTAQVMRGLDFVMRKAMELGKPVAINLSFGNNYGAHNGQSLWENYITELAGVWQNVIVIAAGNEGDARHHASVQLRSQMESISFAISAREKNISLQLWKQYVDEISVFLESPNGQRVQVNQQMDTAQQVQMGNDRILIYYGAPTPYTTGQEIYMEWIPGEQENSESYIAEGIWKILLIPENIKNGRVNLWLPGSEVIGLSTGFLRSDPNITVTIPSVARGVITVGAYHTSNDQIAPFSGRGDTTDGRNMPTLVAPGVDIMTTSAGGGYSSQTGTSIAAPFVTGAAAQLMEWGIVRGNDPYLYGEKAKAYLIKGARRLPGFEQWPNRCAMAYQGCGAVFLFLKKQ